MMFSGFRAGLVAVWLLAGAAAAVPVDSGAAEGEREARAAGVRGCRATYAGAPRKADGHVDAARLLAELSDLGADTYNWLVWHRSTDWEDLRAFLPLARQQGVRVWVTVVPPSESPPRTKTYSEPYRVDYGRWAEEIGRLAAAEPALVAWSIDDFAHNLATFTPEAVRAMLARARSHQPRLAFVPCIYFRQATATLAARYGDLLDGLLFPYRNESVRADLTDAGQVAAEVARLRGLFRPGMPVVVDVYATRHSRLGDSTPAYVGEVLRAGRSAADGVMVYCHQDPRSQAAKYAAIREVLSGGR